MPTYQPNPIDLENLLKKLGVAMPKPQQKALFAELIAPAKERIQKAVSENPNQPENSYLHPAEQEMLEILREAGRVIITAWKKTQVPFIQRDGGIIDQLALIEFKHKEQLNTVEKIIEAFQTAITEWVETTEEGNKVWEESAEQLSLADLLNCTPFLLEPILLKHGIQTWEVIYQFNSATRNNEIPYDQLLAYPDLPEE